MVTIKYVGRNISKVLTPRYIWLANIRRMADLNPFQAAKDFKLLLRNMPTKSMRKFKSYLFQTKASYQLQNGSVFLFKHLKRFSDCTNITIQWFNKNLIMCTWVHFSWFPPASAETRVTMIFVFQMLTAFTINQAELNTTIYWDSYKFLLPKIFYDIRNWKAYCLEKKK